MEVTVKLHRIEDVRQVSERFSTRNFVGIRDWDNEYPQYVEFQLQNHGCDMIDVYQAEQIIKVEFNLNGREWADGQGKIKTFNTLHAWKIQPVK